MPEIGAQSRERALAAAHAAQEAAAELIRFVREGAHAQYPPFGQSEPVETLADALKLTLELEQAEQGPDAYPDDAAERDLLLKAVTRFLDGWVP